MTSRIRCSSATIGLDYLAGDDNATVAPGAVFKTLQKALNVAASGFDIDSTSAAWAWAGNTGQRSNCGVTIQMAQISEANAERLAQPVFLDGTGISGPVTLKGDSSNGGANMALYNLYAANPLQGITTQHGAFLIVDGISMKGDANCTLLNTLRGGFITVNGFRAGRGAGTVCPIGSARGGDLELAGQLRLIGSGDPYHVCDFVGIYAAIQNGRVHFLPGSSVYLENMANFGYAFIAEEGSFWVENAPPWNGQPFISAVPVFGGTGLAGSLGAKYDLAEHSFLGISANAIPGTVAASYCSPSSEILA